MSTLQEIKAAAALLDEEEQELLAADLFSRRAAPDAVQLEASLQAGLDDVAEGRVRPIEEVRELIPRWAYKS